eukprot:5292971-Prorocentrum_lima.AAC.1
MQGSSKKMILRLQTRSGRGGRRKTKGKGAKERDMIIHRVRQDIDVRSGAPLADKPVKDL